MTTLLADIGNTNIKWTMLESGSPGSIFTLRHDGPSTVRDWAADCSGKVDGAVCCNVAGSEVSAAINDALTPARVSYVVPLRTGYGLRNAYDEPGQLGADRWVAMVAAWQRYQAAVCVVDAGTALTVDLIDGAGKHLGGYIVPGRNMMSDMLDRRTRDIRARKRTVDAPAQTGNAPGRNTRDAVSHGSAAACAGLVLQARSILARDERTVPEIVVTGGDAEWLANAVGHDVELAPALVLEGLAVIAEAGGGA